jgi:hypothetical protein
MHPLATSPRLPLSGSAALAAGALVQAALGIEFVLAGLNKTLNPDYLSQFRTIVGNSPAATAGPLAPVLQLLVLPNLDFTAQFARVTELGAGAVLLVTALEVLRRRLSAPIGAQHAYEPLLALAASLSALALGVMSLVNYAILGGALPTINPNVSFSSPIAIELLLVPLALGIAWLEFGRFLALRRATA